MSPAGAKRGAESAEVRNSGPNRPQSKQRRGLAAGKSESTKCGKSAAKVRNLSAHSVPSLPSSPVQTPAPRTAAKRAALKATPYLVPVTAAKTRREVDPEQAPNNGAAEQTTQGAAAPDSGEQELRIEIWPRGYDWWCGTSAQLLAEGVIPSGFEWPKGKAQKRWVSGLFDFWLFRCRPKGHKGPQSSWFELDNWACRRTLAAQRHGGFAGAMLHEERMALADELWSHSHEARIQLGRYCKTLEDRHYQDFRALVMPRHLRQRRA